MASGKTFQLQAGSGEHPVDIEMTTKNYKTLVKNVGKNKWYRFTSDKIVGSGFFKDVGKLVAKKVAPKILDKIGEKTGQKGITNALKGSVDDLVDVGADKITGGKIKKGSPEMKLGSSCTGLPLDLAENEIDKQIDGASIKRRSDLMVKGGTLVAGVPREQVRGKGFTGAGGIKFGGSFKSPTSGGSFSSP
jgi:hypothetical protein